MCLRCNYSVTNLEPVAFDAEDCLDQFGNIHIDDARSNANDWTILAVQLLENEVRISGRRLVQVPQSSELFTTVRGLI